MLGKLFGSNVRVKILKMFVLHPECEYSLKQVIKDLKLQPVSIERELNNLLEFGLISSRITPVETEGTEESDNSGENKEEKSKTRSRIKAKEPGQGEILLFRVDTRFVLYDEIKMLLVRSQILYEKDFLSKINEIGKIKLLILTGIFVNRDDSPVDLLVVGKINKSRLVKLINNLESDLGKEVNFTVMDSSEFKYRRDITDVFLYEILENKRVVIVDEIGV